MRKQTFGVLALIALLGALVPGKAFAQEPQAASGPQAGATFCGVPVAPPAALPPAGSGPVVWIMGPCFMAQGNVSTVEAQTYL